MRKHNYLVGYKGESQCVYGYVKKVYGDREREWVTPMTLTEAKKIRKYITTPTRGRTIKSVIYKLVEVKD